jgi:hypothetical protein
MPKDSLNSHAMDNIKGTMVEAGLNYEDELVVGNEKDWYETDYEDSYNPDFEPCGWRSDYQDYWQERYGSMYINDPYVGWIILYQEDRIREHRQNSYFRRIGYRQRYQARLVYNVLMTHYRNPVVQMYKAFQKNPAIVINPGEAELKELARLANLQGPSVINGWIWKRPWEN